MTTKTYIGTIVEQRYGYRMQGGYEPSLSLDCENGDSVPLKLCDSALKKFK